MLASSGLASATSYITQENPTNETTLTSVEVNFTWDTNYESVNLVYADNPSFTDPNTVADIEAEELTLTLSEGSWWWYLKHGSYETQIRKITISLATNDPEIQLLSPADGLTLTQPTVKLTWLDTGSPDYYLVNLNGRNYQTETTSLEIELEDGSYGWYVKGVYEGYEVKSDIRVFHIDQRNIFEQIGAGLAPLVVPLVVVGGIIIAVAVILKVGKKILW